MLIGISGKMGSGKNEVADMISFLLFRNCNGTYQQFREAQDIRNTYLKYKNYYDAEITLPNIHSFANKLKKFVGIATGVNFHELDNRNVKSSKIPWMDISYRELLQRLGEAVRRGVDENFWVHSLLVEYNNSDIWIISDVRYKNEADEIKRRGGILIRINRDDLNKNDHISETDLDDYENFDCVIDNNGTLEDLFNKIEREINLRFIYNDVLSLLK